MDWNSLLTSLTPLLTTTGVVYLLIDKLFLSKKDKVEVKKDEVTVKADDFAHYVRMVNDMKSRYDVVCEEKDSLNKKVDGMRASIDELKLTMSNMTLKLEDANWYRCEVPGCTFRRPPRSRVDTPCEKLDAKAPTPIAPPAPEIY